MQCRVDCGIGVSEPLPYLYLSSPKYEVAGSSRPFVITHDCIYRRIARTGCLYCTLRSPRPCDPNAALLDLFLSLLLFLFPFPGDRCCAALTLTSTYPTKPRLDCARSLETPRYDS